jgi:hypothetical protein
MAKNLHESKQSMSQLGTLKDDLGFEFGTDRTFESIRQGNLTVIVVPEDGAGRV